MLIPFETPLYKEFVDGLPDAIKEILRRYQAGEIEFITAIDRLHNQLSQPRWLRFTCLIPPAVEPSVVRRLSRGWDPLRRTEVSPAMLGFLLPPIVQNLACGRALGPAAGPDVPLAQRQHPDARAGGGI